MSSANIFLESYLTDTSIVVEVCFFTYCSQGCHSLFSKRITYLGLEFLTWADGRINIMMQYRCSYLNGNVTFRNTC